MQFDLTSPGLIILNQFKTLSSQDNIHNYWYVSTEGLSYFKNNLGVLSHLNMPCNHILESIVEHYKLQFEFTFKKIDLGFFEYWSCLQIQTLYQPKKSYHSNVSRFLENLNVPYTFDNEQNTYHFKDFPEITTQLDVYHFINKHITQDLGNLFQSHNIAQCSLTEQDFIIFDQFTNKIDFLEKYRFKTQLENQFPIKNLSKKIKI